MFSKIPRIENQRPQYKQCRQRQQSASRRICLAKPQNRLNISKRIPGRKLHLDDPSEKLISESIQQHEATKFINQGVRMF